MAAEGRPVQPQSRVVGLVGGHARERGFCPLKPWRSIPFLSLLFSDSLLALAPCCSVCRGLTPHAGFSKLVGDTDW